MKSKWIVQSPPAGSDLHDKDQVEITSTGITANGSPWSTSTIDMSQNSVTVTHNGTHSGSWQITDNGSTLTATGGRSGSASWTANEG